MKLVLICALVAQIFGNGSVSDLPQDINLGDTCIQVSFSTDAGEYEISYSSEGWKECAYMRTDFCPFFENVLHFDRIPDEVQVIMWEDVPPIEEDGCLLGSPICGWVFTKDAWQQQVIDLLMGNSGI